MFEKETVDKIKESVAFAIYMDESEVNKKSQLECVVKMATKECGVETKHYGVLDIESTDAATIVNSLVDKMISDGIDYKAKCIDISTDGCNMMVGVKTSKDFRNKFLRSILLDLEAVTI